MATSSSSSVSPKRYDVFISFRGDDTRGNFTSHLHDALIRNQILTYIDDRLNKGEEITPALFKAIEDSQVSIIVFSENYASSKWCLDELLKILECRKEGQDVIPVFYKVDPSNVRKLKRSYEEAFAKHECDFSNNQDKLNKWKQALFEAANIAGWDSRVHGDESKLIHKIVEDVLKKLEYKYPQRESKCPFGINENLAPIESLLRESQMIGIWGMGGIGKTTVAKWFFDKYSPQYEGSCFLANIRDNFGNHGQALRNELVSKLLGEYERTTNVESNVAKRRLFCKRVFVVLDDVNTSKQLEYLVEELKCFGSSSRIIITTRDKHVLISKGVDKIHDVKALNFQESLQLFSLNAFNQNQPLMGYEELSNRVVDYAKGLPLVLKVLGAFLHSKSKSEWECALKKLKRIPNDEIHSVLKLSYDGLNHEEREIFLDIACFLKGERKERVISLLDSYDFYADIGLRTLQDNALITIEHDVVQMHDLVQEMGWEIVRQESIKEPGKRSRLWDPKEVYDVLKNNKGSDTVEGINVDMSQIKDLYLSVDTFKIMTNLRFLRFYSPSGVRYSCLCLPTSLQLYSDKLRYLEWDGCLSKSFPLSFCPENLVELLMPGSQLEKLWDGVQELVNLKRINLRRSRKLMELPDFSMASNLETVDLSNCESLRHVHPSLLSLHSLISLDLSWCKELKSLESEIHLRSLKFLIIYGCSSLKKFSVSSAQMRQLILWGTKIEILPSSIGRLSRLKRLVFHGLRLQNLPNELSCLRNLEELVISDCSRIMILKQKLHIIFPNLKSLKKLYLGNCSHLLELPNNISLLLSLHSLDLSGSNIECLPASIKQLTRLLWLSLSNCNRLRYLPELPQSITKICLRESNIEFLPASVKHLTKLMNIDFNGCKRLRSLPELPQSIRDLDLSRSNIECLPANINRLIDLRVLRLNECKRLGSLPKLPQSITHLDLKESNIECFPASIRELTGLTWLCLSDCRKLQYLPELPQLITKILLDGSNIGCLPTSIKQLSKLRHIDLSDCKSLKSLPRLPQSLTKIHLKGSNIECLPASIKQLTNLRQLDLCDCKRLRSLPELPSSITYLDATNCTSLETIIMTRTSTLWKEKRQLSTYFVNCVKLDEHAMSSILKDNYYSIMQSVYNLNSEIEWRFNICFPGSRVPECFKNNRTTKDSITIELDQSLQIVAFTFCLVISPFSSNQGEYTSIKCYQDGGTSISHQYCSLLHANWGFVKDHVIIWYHPSYSFSNIRTTFNSTFKFDVQGRNGKPHPYFKIKECGVCPIYASKGKFFHASIHGLSEKQIKKAKEVMMTSY